MMAGMTNHMLFRKQHKSILALVILIAYLCFVVRFTKDPRSLVIFVGLAVLALIFFFPWPRRDDMSKQPRKHGKRRKRI
jgi:hypothetical protein